MNIYIMYIILNIGELECMLVKINVENFANEMINLLGLVTNECGYILSDSSIKIDDITDYNKLVADKGLLGIEKDVRVSFVIKEFDGSEYLINLMMKQVFMDYDFNKEILFGFYTVKLKSLSEDTSLDAENKIFEELFVSSKIASYFNKDSILSNIPYEELSYNLLKINLDDYVADINRLVEYAFEHSSINYRKESIEVICNLNDDVLARKVIMVTFDILNSGGENCRNVNVALELVHMQYDFREEIIYGFFIISLADVISMEFKENDSKYISMASLIYDNGIYGSFNR